MLIVTLQLGVPLDVRFLRVALVPGFLVLPPVLQIGGQGVLGVREGIDHV
jgi:hypothetical protein